MFRLSCFFNVSSLLSDAVLFDKKKKTLYSDASILHLNALEMVIIVCHCAVRGLIVVFASCKEIVRVHLGLRVCHLQKTNFKKRSSKITLYFVPVHKTKIKKLRDVNNI